MNHINTMLLITAGILVIIVTAISSETVLGFVQSVSAQSVGTGSSTDFGSSSSASLNDRFEGTPGSVSSSGEDSSSASGTFAICGGIFVIQGVCTEATR
jgi:hypothetical protein